MSGVYQRGDRLWIWFFDVTRVRVDDITTFRPGEEDRARERLFDILARVRLARADLAGRLYGNSLFDREWRERRRAR